MKFKFVPIIKDISLTFVTEVLILLSFFLIYNLLAANFGPEGVGIYSLIRRVIGFLQPLLLLGLTVGIPRYIAMSKNGEETAAYMKSGSIAIVLFSIAIIVFFNLFDDFFSQALFGSISYAYLIVPLSICLLGLNVHSLVYSYLRGKLMVKVFNLLQIINVMLVPIVILVSLNGVAVEKFIALAGAVNIFVALVFASVFFSEKAQRMGKNVFESSFWRLLGYSLPRIPADFSLALLFSLGPIIAIRFVPIEEVGYLSVSQSLLNAAGSIIAPLGLIILPKVSGLIKEKKKFEIKEGVNIFIGAIIQCSIFIYFQMIIFSDAIIGFWLGSGFLEAAPVMRIVFVSVIFFTMYVGMRSILDAVEHKPLNTINLLLSLSIFLISSYYFLFIYKVLPAIISLGAAFSFSMAYLGISTYGSIRKIYPEKSWQDLQYVSVALVINIAISFPLEGFKILISSKIYYLAGFELILGLFYLLILWLLKMEWIRQLPERIIKNA